VIPSFDSFDYFSSVLPLLVVLIPICMATRRGGLRRLAFATSGTYLLLLIAPRLALFYVVFWLVMAGLQPLVARTGELKTGLWVLWTSLGITMAPMVAWKIWPIEFVIRFNVWSNRPIRATSDIFAAIDTTAPIVAAIGLSFSSFRAADLLIKSNLGLVGALTPGRVLAFGLFPPLLVVGPIASYDETEKTLENRVDIDPDRALRGAVQILVGLFKVFVLAYLLSWSPDIFGLFETNSPWRIWLSLIAFTWFFYVNFAGYSDIAIGSGRLLGADLRPNFDSPYRRTNPAAFWNSWHISLTRFLRANVFTPIVGGNARRQYAATALIMVLIGLWHSVGWATLVFGLYHGVSLIGHRMLEQRRPPRLDSPWQFVKPVGIFTWFGLSLPLLQLPLDRAIDFYGVMIGVGT
jgi:alginate O-acetyltransferase complex protein AlgI